MILAFVGRPWIALGQTQPAVSVAERIGSTHLPNALKLHPKVISGGMPEGEAAFAELKSFGVRTIISVDGAKPNTELANRFGMRYVHLPHGYDGIPEGRTLELAKALRECDGPVYLHCHHGKHRSPAAAAVACAAIGLIRPQDAVGVLELAGTNKNYRGLYESAEKAKRIADEVLDRLHVDLPAVAKLPPLAESMVEIEIHHDRLKKMAAQGWVAAPEGKQFQPASEALLLKELYVEILRLNIVSDASSEHPLFVEARELADQLEQAITEHLAEGRSPSTEKLDALNISFGRISQNCVDCHRRFRDVPLSEKR